MNGMRQHPPHVGILVLAHALEEHQRLGPQHIGLVEEAQRRGELIGERERVHHGIAAIK